MPRYIFLVNNFFCLTVVSAKTSEMHNCFSPKRMPQLCKFRIFFGGGAKIYFDHRNAAKPALEEDRPT